MSWDVVLALLSVASHRLHGRERRRVHRPQRESHARWDKVMGVALIVLVIEATRRTSGWIMPIVIGGFLAYAFAGPVPAAPWTHRGYDIDAPRGPHVHDARGHLRRRGGRLGHAHHPVHDLRRVPAVLGRGQVLPRFLLLAPRRQDRERRARGRARLVPAGRPVGLGRGDDGDHRLGGLPDARSARATRRTRRAACSPPAAWAPSSRRRCWARPRSSSRSSSRSRTSR